jgi:aspartate/methionine/tyrosine aminotransferase
LVVTHAAATVRAQLSRRVHAITQSVTMAVDARAKALRAEGVDVITFGVGEPDFPTPPHIVEAAVAACRDEQNHHYGPAAGLPELREVIAAKTLRDSRLEVAADQVVVANGGKHAVYNAFQILLDPGDEVLLPTPCWNTYPEAIALADGVPVVVPTTDAGGFRATVDQLEAARTPRTKALVFVSPSNPTGAVYPRDEVEAIGRWAAGHGIWVITDEIYEHLTFGEHTFTSMPALVPELADRCIVVNGVAKTYAMTGWRIGWLIGPAEVATVAADLQSHQVTNVSHVAQRAALTALADLEGVETMRAAFDRRGRTMHELLNRVPGVQCSEPQGAFYCFPRVTEVLGREIGGRVVHDTLALCEALLETAHVALVPGEAFGAPGFVRLSFALSDDSLVEGMERIAKALG